VALLKRIKSNLKALDINSIIGSILSQPEVKKFIIELNTKGQPSSQLFEQGIDSLGISLGNYAGTTIEGTSNFEGKKEKGQRFDHITLEDTGDFYNSFVVTVGKDKITIEADPIKEDTNLLVEYGNDILGLTDQNLQLVIDHLRDGIKKEFKAAVLRGIR